MDFKQNIIRRSKNPKEHANFFSKLTFFYMTKIIKDTRKNNFGEKEMYQPLCDLKSQTLGLKFEKLWTQKRKFDKNGKQNKVGAVGLLWILTKMFWKKFIIFYIMLIISKITLTICQPLIFGKIVAHFRYPNPNIYYLGMSLVAINFINFFIVQHFHQTCAEISLQIAVALSSAIYRKAIRLKNEVRINLESKVGNVVTLITKDVFAFSFLIFFLSTVLNSIIIITIQMMVIYGKVGWIGLLTVIISIGIVIFEFLLGILSQSQRYKECVYAAQRINVLKETFSLIQVVKMSLLENFFIKRCNEYRKKEIFHLLNVCLLRMINMLMGKLGCASSFIITVFIYNSVNGDFSAEKLFFLSSSIEVIRSFFNYTLPYGISRSAESIASIKRLGQYFSISEFSLGKSFASNNIFNKTADKPKVKVHNLCIDLNGKTIVKNVTFEIVDRCLLVVTGPIGSGKTMLLKAILGELETSLENLDVKGSFSYAAQDPWLFPGTIRQNIIFGQEYDKDRYLEVVERCALSYDFSKFKNGDNTLVIDDGINLSKGQKMRINLARAIYQNKQIYLLDSVLNCVDVHTNKYIFQRVMKEFLKDKICIFVSDNPLHIQNADQVIRFSKNMSSKLICNKETATQVYSFENIPYNTESNQLSIEEDVNEISKLLQNNNNKTEEDCSIQNIYREQNKKGNVKFSTYRTYTQFCGGIWIVLYLIVIFILAQICLITSQKFMSIWINSEEKLYKLSRNITFSTESPNYENLLHERNHSFQIYIIGFVFHVLFYITGSLSTLYICTRAAKKIHKAMVKSVVYSQMEFFCTTLLGTILNRFSKDINNIDEWLPTLVYNSFMMLFDSLGLFVMIALAQWIFLIPILIMILIALIILKLILLPVATKSKRLEAALHSPMVGYLNCTLNGLSTIRVLGPNQEKLNEEFDYHQDLFASAFYISFCTDRILQIFLQIACQILLAVVILYFVLSENSRPGDVGLGIGKTLVIIRIIDYTLVQYMQMEALLTSLERVCDYLHLKQENRSGIDLSKNWKSDGSLIIRNLNLIYKSTNQHVLKNINLSIKPGEKIAIVGRTGSGKSSLISCMYRMYHYTGNIIINGVDIKGLELNFLRSKFSVISQDALVFSGSFRENIDPLKEHSDREILLIIFNVSKYFKASEYKPEQTIIKDIINCNVDLQMQINKDMLSAGEKQMVNLLRVMLNRTEILILDELAEDLDEEAGAAMQQIIKEFFENCTVLSIYHKLTNLEKMDKICVIQDGNVVEFDTPINLLNNPESQFCKMVTN